METNDDTISWNPFPHFGQLEARPTTSNITCSYHMKKHNPLNYVHIHNPTVYTHSGDFTQPQLDPAVIATCPMSLQLPAPRAPLPWHPPLHPTRPARGPPAAWGAGCRAGAVAAAVHLVARRGKLPGTEIQSKAPEGERYEERWEVQCGMDQGDGWGMGSHFFFFVCAIFFSVIVVTLRRVGLHILI